MFWIRLSEHLLHTVFEIFFSLACALVFSAIFSMVILYFRRGGSLIASFLAAFQSIPLFLLSPFLVFVFGFSIWVVVIPTGLLLSFPLTLSISKAFAYAPREMVAYYAQLGKSKATLFFQIFLPYGIPALLSGIKVAASSATLSVLACEWTSGSGGLGVFIQELRRDYALEEALIALSAGCILSFALYGSCLCLEKWLLRRYA